MQAFSNSVLVCLEGSVLFRFGEAKRSVEYVDDVSRIVPSYIGQGPQGPFNQMFFKKGSVLRGKRWKGVYIVHVEVRANAGIACTKIAL